MSTRGRPRRLPPVAVWTLGLAAVATAGVVAGIAVGASRHSGPASPGDCPAATGWLQLQGDAAHTGVASGGGSPTALRVRWTRAVGGLGGVAATAGDVLVGAGGGVVDLGAGDGAVRWGWATPASSDRVAGPPAVSGCMVAVTAATGEGAAGQVRGEVRVVGRDAHAPVRTVGVDALSAGGLLAATGGGFASVGGTVSGGGVRWQLREVGAAAGDDLAVDVGGFAPGPPAEVAGLTVVATWAQSVVALGPGGRLAWSAPLDALPLSAPAASGGVVLVGTAAGIEAVDASRGTVRWASPLAAGVAAPPVVVDGVAVVVARDGSVVGLDLHDGRRTWVASVPAASAPAVVVGGSILVASQDGTLSVLDAHGAVRLSTRLPAGVDRPLAVDGRRLYALGTDGSLTAVDLG